VGVRKLPGHQHRTLGIPSEREHTSQHFGDGHSLQQFANCLTTRKRSHKRFKLDSGLILRKSVFDFNADSGVIQFEQVVRKLTRELGRIDEFSIDARSREVQHLAEAYK